MALSDRRYAYGPFVPHWIPKQYLSEYFSWHGLDQNLVLNTTVEDVSRIPPTVDSDNRWRLTLRKQEPAASLDEWWQEEFDAVVIANGHYAVPFVSLCQTRSEGVTAPLIRLPAYARIQVPNVPGLPEYLDRFPGRVVHSKVYRTPQTFSGKRVLVIGNSASGHDISEQLVASELVPKPVYLSRRSSKPWDGDASPDGLIWKPVIKEYRDGNIVFDDGTHLAKNEIDAIIYCTGYQPSYPFWNVEVNGRPLFNYEEERLVGNYQHVFFPEYPTLGVVGFPRALSFRSFEYQSIALARVFSGRAVLPTTAQQKEWESKRIIEARKNHESFHKLAWDDGEILAYLEYLYHLAGLPSLIGNGSIPPVLDKETRWALEHIKKYPVKDPKGDSKSDDEGGWYVMEKMKRDSLWFL